MDYLKAFVLGCIEGLTEFLPVSSTGHLLLVGHFLGFTETSLGKTFAILIQLGAILAILAVYLGQLLKIAIALPTDPNARRFVLGVILAFLPAMVLGFLARDFIRDVLFNPLLVCCTLIAGGLILLVIDETDFDVRHDDAKAFPLAMYAKIGLFQCLAMVPGVSRSGATIVGALIFGANKRAATEFSFFLAIPTMIGAFSYELLKSYKQMSTDGAVLVAIGFVTSFVVGLFVVRYLLDYVARHGFGLFAWWRIIVGTAGLLGLWILG